MRVPSLSFHSVLPQGTVSLLLCSVLHVVTTPWGLSIVPSFYPDLSRVGCQVLKEGAKKIALSPPKPLIQLLQAAPTGLDNGAVDPRRDVQPFRGCIQRVDMIHGAVQSSGSRVQFNEALAALAIVKRDRLQRWQLFALHSILRPSTGASCVSQETGAVAAMQIRSRRSGMV